MNKRKAQKAATENTKTFRQLLEMINTGMRPGSISILNKSFTHEQSAEIFKAAIKERNLDDTPDDRLGDMLLVRNIYREFG